MEDGIRVVELFAGVGGFRLGLQASSDRFETVWANQWEPGSRSQFAFDCYQAHFGGSGSVNVNEDIAVAKEGVPRDFDLLVGGFPCQDYSVATTKARGIEGRKGVLWWSIRDIVAAHRPRYVLLENVDRLLKSPASQRGRDFAVILRCMADLGYTAEWRVINAADYGFVQKRRRTFMFFCRGDLPHAIRLRGMGSGAERISGGFFSREFPADVPDRVVEFSVGTGEYPTLVEVSDGFSGPFLNSGAMADYRVFTCDSAPRAEPQKALRSILVDDADARYSQEGSLDKWREMKGAKRIERVRKSDGGRYMYSEGAIPFPDNLDGPGRTMLTSEGSRNRSSHLVLDPATGVHRTLTPVECERMNGFPDGWTGMLTDRQRYFAMGNALVVGLIERMGREILRVEGESRAGEVAEPSSEGSQAS